MTGEVQRTNPDRRLRRTSVPVLRAAWWTLKAHTAVRRELRGAGRALAVTVAPPPPGLPLAASRGVRGTLSRRHATCLERSLVLQTWLAAHGERHDIVIGVTAPGEDFQAHAWLDGLEPANAYQELTRLPAVSSRRTGP